MRDYDAYYNTLPDNAFKIPYVTMGHRRHHLWMFSDQAREVMLHHPLHFFDGDWYFLGIQLCRPDFFLKFVSSSPESYCDKYVIWRKPDIVFESRHENNVWSLVHDVVVNMYNSYDDSSYVNDSIDLSYSVTNNSLDGWLDEKIAALPTI